MVQSPFIVLLASIFVAIVAADDAPFEVPGVFNFSDLAVGATLEHFEVSSDNTAVTKFACEDIGSRCVFSRQNFASVDVGIGQETENTQGKVWGATKEGARLTLGPCTGNDDTATSRAGAVDSNSCVVTCNANCTCAYVTADTNNEPQLCQTLVSRAPTPSPKTAAPVPKVCTQQQFATEFCPTLMQSGSIPDGTIDNYDCFNFCGGIWIDTCDIATGTCGTTQCDNATATGTLNGVVKGCTREHYYSQQPSKNHNANGVTSNGRIISVFSKTVTASMIIALCSLSSIVNIW